MVDILPQVEAQKLVMLVRLIDQQQMEYCMLNEHKMTIRLLYDLTVEPIMVVQVIQP